MKSVMVVTFLLCFSGTRVSGRVPVLPDQVAIIRPGKSRLTIIGRGTAMETCTESPDDPFEVTAIETPDTTTLAVFWVGRVAAGESYRIPLVLPRLTACWTGRVR